MDAFAASFLKALVPVQKGATVVALQGDLGAGKTTFVQGLAKALNVREHITSPTFVIQKIYPIAGDVHFDRLVHIDAYRLEGKQELDILHFGDDVEDPKTLVCIEWPEKVPGITVTHTLVFEWVSETERSIKVLG